MESTRFSSIIDKCEAVLKRSGCTNGTNEPFNPFKRRKNEETCTSSRESRILKADLIGARANIVFLENKLKQLGQERLKMQIMHDAKVRKLEEHTCWDKIQIRELNKTLTKVREREAKVEEELANLQNKFDVLRLSSDVNIERFENLLANLKADYSIERSRKREELGKQKLTITELQRALQMSEEIEASQKIYIDDLEKRLAEKNEVGRQLEMKAFELYNAHLELKTLQYLKENYDLYQLQIKTHEKKLYGYDAIEKENQQLKEDNQRLRELIKGKLLLEEQVYDLNIRLKRYKTQEAELVDLKEQQVQSDRCLNEWRAIANGLCEADVPDSRIPNILRNAIETLQKQEINLTADKVSLESDLSTLVHESRLTASDLDKTRNQFLQLKENCEESKNLIQRLQNKLTITCAERDSYKAQLESYEVDLARTISTKPGPKDVRKMDKDVIKKLNGLVEGYRATVAKLEDELKNVKPIQSKETLNDKVIVLQAEINNLKAQNDFLRKRRDSLEVHLEKLANVGFKSDYRQTDDYQALLKQVEHLTEELKVKHAEFEDQKLQIQVHENRLDNLKEYCKASLDEYRNVIYILFGYKIDSENDNQYTLTSIFAHDDEDEQLCFQLGSEGVMNLLENKYSLSLGKLIDIHLRRHKSIPMFLSAITMDLFNNQQAAALETVELDDDSNDSTAEFSDGGSSKISVYDSSDKSSEFSKRSDSPPSKASDSSETSSDEYS